MYATGSTTSCVTRIGREINNVSNPGYGAILSMPEVDLGSVLELELGQKWRYGALKACIG